jgi:hypothetical protein
MYPNSIASVLLLLTFRAESIDRKLPEFSLLVNFPEHLSKFKNYESNTSSSGTKHCVMCGQLRLCSTNHIISSNGIRQQQKRSTPWSSVEDPSNEGTERTTQIIPRQNKGVCTECDVAVWVVRDRHDKYEIKWCKGCKNFRPWAAFGDEGLATKCVRCRKRQKEKYATQKVSGRTSYDNQDDESYMHQRTIVAANGLHQMMKGSPP